MTSKQRQAALRARRKDQGLVRVEVWVPEDERAYIKRCAEHCKNPGRLTQIKLVPMTDDEVMEAFSRIKI